MTSCARRGAKLLTLFRPATGEVRAQGVTSVTNAVLHPWRQAQWLAVLEAEQQAKAAQEEPAPPPKSAEQVKAHEGETGVGWRLSDRYPPLRMMLVWDHLAGHRRDAIRRWRLAHGSMPLYTPLAGSWVNLAESLQRLLVKRALAGQDPQSPQQIIDWLEQTVAGWNLDPTPFEWHGKRRERRQRAHLRRLAGSGAAVLTIAI